MTGGTGHDGPRRRPSTLPADLGIGILHLGLGAFHRAHQATYTEDAIAAAGGDWAIAAVSMRNPALAATLNAQQGRYTLIERHPDGPHLHEISAIRRAHALPDAPGDVLARFADPGLQIVTVTVTEKGYGMDPATRRLNPADPAVARDLVAPDDPRHLLGVLAAGLARRRTAGLGGLTVMSCDNLTGNGALLAALTDDMATARDPALARWIGAECRFPDSMVDRITPAATDATLALAAACLGHPDPAAVETEPFRQWVIADDFAGARPAWDRAGALFVADVAPFEAMKLRMLNGAHSLIAYAGTVAGLDCVRDVMASPELAALARAHMAAAADTLAPLDGYDPAAYADDLARRFANPAIDHRCRQIAMDGSQKLPQRIFATARARLDSGCDIATCALATALWMRHIEGRAETGATIPLDDPLARDLRAAVAGRDADDAVAALGAVRGLAGHDLFADPRWCHALADRLRRLRQGGVRAAARETATRPSDPPNCR